MSPIARRRALYIGVVGLLLIVAAVVDTAAVDGTGELRLWTDYAAYRMDEATPAATSNSTWS